MDWLTGIPFEMEGRSLSRVIAPLRWDTARFEAASDLQIAEFLPAPLQIFRRSLWIKAMGDATTLQGQFRKMGAIALPQICALEIGQWSHGRKAESDSTWGSGSTVRVPFTIGTFPFYGRCIGNGAITVLYFAMMLDTKLGVEFHY